MRVGRPKKYDTKKQLSNAIEKYFRSISTEIVLKGLDGREIISEDGKPMKKRIYPTPPSISGLCLHIGIDRSTWQNYCQREEFKTVCENARLRIEAYLEEQLLTREKNIQGIKFNLQHNFSWKERAEIDLGKETRESVAISNMSMEEKMVLIKTAKGMMPGTLAAEDAEDDEDTEC